MLDCYVWMMIQAEQVSVMKETYSKQPLRIALIEPTESDARWFEMLVCDTGLEAVTTRYPTGMAALKVWTLGLAGATDVIVVADVLPMLSTEEFVNAARAVYPDVRIFVAGECLYAGTLSPLPTGVQRLMKPLSPEDMFRLLHAIPADSKRPADTLRALETCGTAVATYNSVRSRISAPATAASMSTPCASV